MENPKKTRGDGVFGWPTGGLTFAAMIIGVILNNVFDSQAPAYICVGISIMIEVIHYRWKLRH